MRISELDRVAAIAYTENGKVDVAKQMIKHFIDKMTPQEKAYSIAYKWVMPFSSEEEFKEILKWLDTSEHLLRKEEIADIEKQYRYKYDRNICSIGLVCYEIHDYICLTVIYDTDSNGETEITYDNLDNSDGVLCYVNNLNEPFYSEAGSVYFKWVGDGYVKHS